MANTPKKMKDPTEAALSAIQDALQVRDVDQVRDADKETGPGSPPPSPLMADEPLSDTPWPGLRSSQTGKTDLFDDEMRRPEETGTLRRPAANDDQESIGQILRGLQRRPARTSYILASIFAAVWVVGGFALGWLYLPSSRRRSARPASPRRCLPCLARSISPPWSSSTCSPTWPGGRRNCG